MVTQPTRYTELASYREQIQFANCKFRWSSVNIFDIHSRMVYAKKLQHDSGARLDILDTSLYATVLNAPANALDVSPSTIWSGTVHFLRRIRWRRLRRKMCSELAPGTPSFTRTPHGSTLSGTPQRARKEATSSNEKPATKGPNANEPGGPS